MSHNQEFLSSITKEVWIISGDGNVQVNTLQSGDKTETGDLVANFNQLYENYKSSLRREARKEMRRHK